ncbi:MAG: LD-carboxypeptidase [Chitinophagaceae bacterium]|nr:LD-carboxypeptidase [Chitinophagaceae bacterium]
MATIPPYLKKGDTIGLVAPAGFMPEKKFQVCVQTLQNRGFKVKMGKTPGHQFHYFSGTDKERKNDLQKFLDDEKIKAILCVRGGYGTGRIIEDLDFKKFAAHPKWVIGFSDITVLHCHIFSNYQIPTLHAPMAGAFNKEGFKNEYVGSLFDALSGKKADYKVPAHAFNKKGKASGVLVGGNLMLFTHLIGTSSEVDTRNRILFIEDTGEYIYSVDRMMYQLKRVGKLKNLKGLIVGRFSDMKDTTIPFGQSVEEVIRDVVKEYDYPKCFNFPVGHQDENYALKVGGRYSLIVEKNNVSLTEK